MVTVKKRGECYKKNIPRKETKKRNALLNFFPAYQIYHGFKKISKGNYKHDRQFKVNHAGGRGDKMTRSYLPGSQ